MPKIDRRAIYERDQGLCGFCEPVSLERFHIDHITPRAMGGSNNTANLRVAHVRCNISAGALATVGTRRPSKPAEPLAVFNARIPPDLVQQIRQVADLQALAARQRGWREHLMLDPTGKPTPRLRASVLALLREELEGQLQRLQELERWIKQSTGDDNRERVRADAVAVAIEHLQQAIAALELASRE